MRENKRDFFRNIDNYILMNNDVVRRDYVKQNKLNPVKVAKNVFMQKFGFTNDQWGELAEYDGYVCEPEHLDYQQVVNDSKWNTYGRVVWNPKPGKWPTIERLIKHLYGKNSAEEDQVEELYDYHTVMVKWPKLKQQARVLYSHQQKTSKSALAILESLMFQDNYSKIRDGELESTFNSIWVSSILLHIDEPEFSNPKKMSKTIRDLITSPVMNLRKMQTEYENVHFYAKLLFTTNDSDFMPFLKSDRRFWIREAVPVLEEHKDNDFNEKIKEEVNHYLYFLITREMKYARAQDETFWLPQSVIQTNGFKKLVADNKSDLENRVTEIIEQWFIKHPKENELLFRLKDIKCDCENAGNIKSSKYVDLDYVIILREALKIEQPKKNSRPKSNQSILTSNIDKIVGKWWVAKREFFDTDCDIFDNPSTLN